MLILYTLCFNGCYQGILTTIPNPCYFFSYLVGAVGLQIIWSLVLAIADLYAILVKRSFRNATVISLFAIGDGVRHILRLFSVFSVFKSVFST